MAAMTSIAFSQLTFGPACAFWRFWSRLMVYSAASGSGMRTDELSTSLSSSLYGTSSMQEMSMPQLSRSHSTVAVTSTWKDFATSMMRGRVSSSTLSSPPSVTNCSNFAKASSVVSFTAAVEWWRAYRSSRSSRLRVAAVSGVAQRLQVLPAAGDVALELDDDQPCRSV